MTTNNEAPLSISVTAYYKGFSMIVTKRDPDMKNERVLDLLNDQKEIIDFMLEKGFKPSWNEETNKQALSEGKQAPEKSISDDPGTGKEHENIPGNEDVAMDMCPIHRVKMFMKQGKFGNYYSHGEKLENGTWRNCSGKGWK